MTVPRADGLHTLVTNARGTRADVLRLGAGHLQLHSPQLLLFRHPVSCGHWSLGWQDACLGEWPARSGRRTLGFPTMNQSLEGQVAVVTGGGRGLGRAFAVALAHENTRVAVIARSIRELQETVHLVERAGGSARAHVADVTDHEATVRIVAEIR